MNLKLDRVFCTIDFSEFTQLVLHYGIRFAQKFDARLLVFHAVYSPRDQLYGSTLFERGGERARLVSAAHETIGRLMQNCPVPWEAIVRVGDPVEVVARMARKLDVDLVVAASWGHSGLKRILLGTVVERMARTITRPFLVLRSGPERLKSQKPVDLGQVEQIAVGSNFTADAELATRYAWQLARAFGAELTLVHALESPLDENFISSTHGPYQMVQDELQNRHRQLLLQQVPGAQDEIAAVKTHLATGLPGEALLDYAARSGPDLIVVGVHQRGVFGKFLISSTTETLLRQAPCPVLVIPHAKTDDYFHRIFIKHKGALKTGIVKDDRFLKHVPGGHHPESHSRLEAVYRKLDASELIHSLVSIPPRAARTDELTWVHTPEYLAKIAATAGKSHVSLTADTYTSADSYETARLAAGGLFEAIDRVVAGRLVNAFALIRPPGHHAESGRALGFCLFNNVALGAVYAQRRLGLKKVLIVDWDVHHGNGTQHFFEEDPSVLFFSVHQQRHFPGTGFMTETGRGAGEGYTINVPLPRGWGDEELVALFEALLHPVAVAFQPELILVSAGFDTHIKDPMGGMELTASGFAGLTRSLMDLADKCCHGRLVLVLEGGYHSKALAHSVLAVLKELSNATVSDVTALAAQADQRKLKYVLKRCLPVQRRYWKHL
jgi:acetoin utilization deacetylase AcuC-like enzyme/nucleotide-binding universal stress UspA family protein